MKFKSTTKMMLCVTIALGIWMSGQWLPAEVTLRPAKPLKFNGSVVIAVRPYNTFLTLFMRVRQGADMAPGLKVALMGRTASEDSPGVYRCEIPGFSPTPGTLVTVTFDKKPTIPFPHPAEKTFPLTAKATVGSLITFTSPPPEAHINLTPLAILNIAWSGGNPPYSITIYPFKGPDSLGPEVFTKTGIAGTSISVPMTIFKPGVKYGIYLSATMAEFKFSEKVDAASNFILRQSVATYFYTE